MQRVIVTGESTPEGEVVVSSLRAQGAEVCVIDDILAADLPDQFLAFRPDVVVHAAVSHAQRVADNARFNVLGMLAVLEAARLSGAKHFVYASSADVEPRPSTLLAVAKLTGERYCHCYRMVHGLPSTVVRLREGDVPAVRAEALLHAVYAISTVDV